MKFDMGAQTLSQLGSQTISAGDDLGVLVDAARFQGR